MLIDVEGGFTQEEQMAELEVMRSHFGEDVATIEGEPWTAELHHHDQTASPRHGEYFNHNVRFDVSGEDLEELYGLAGEIAEELGLTENINNSHGLDHLGGIFYGAGREEGRVFLIRGRSPDFISAVYETRRSDHPSIKDARRDILDRREEECEFGPDNPRTARDADRAREEGTSLC